MIVKNEKTKKNKLLLETKELGEVMDLRQSIL